MIFLLDTSPSIYEAFDTIKSAAHQFFDSLNPSPAGTHGGVIGFYDVPEVYQTLTGNRQLLHNAIDSFVIGPGTNIAAAIEAGTEEFSLRDREDSVHPDFMVLLSDGLSPRESARKAADQAKSAGITIYTVGIGEQAVGDNEQLLKDIASSENHYFPSQDIQGLKKILEGLAGGGEDENGPDLLYFNYEVVEEECLDCEVEGECRNHIEKQCSASSVKNTIEEGKENDIDDWWCTYNEHDNCRYVKSGVNLVEGQNNPDFWSGESCRYDASGDRSILYGEKKVYVDDISRYIIEARVRTIDDIARVAINGRDVSSLETEFPDEGDWVDVTTYFQSDWNLVQFEATDFCSPNRRFDLDWRITRAACPDCEVEEVCVDHVEKQCTASDAKDNDISQLGNSIDDRWCTCNIHDGCECVKQGVKIVNGQSNPDFWDGESCWLDSSGDRSILKGEKIVVVDDVMTTGATMDECARALKAAGTEEVYGLVLARQSD